MQLKDFLKTRGRGSLKALAIELDVSENRVSRWCRKGFVINRDGVIRSIDVWQRVVIQQCVRLSNDENLAINNK